jgi:hypothetical protein
MMQHSILKYFVCTLITISAHAGYAQPSAEASKAGTVKLVKGQVQIENAQGAKALRSGDAITTADVVATGKDGAASLVLRDGSTLMVGPGSRLEVKGFVYNSTTQEGNLLVSLVRGSLRMITGLIGKGNPESVEIRTPTTIVGVLGTDFIVQAEGEVKP